MSKYVLAFRGQPDRTPAPEEEQAWGAWFGQLGPAPAAGLHPLRRATSARIDTAIAAARRHRPGIPGAADPAPCRRAAAREGGHDRRPAMRR